VTRRTSRCNSAGATSGPEEAERPVPRRRNDEVIAMFALFAALPALPSPRRASLLARLARRLRRG
jgi:hypothetical protein